MLPVPRGLSGSLLPAPPQQRVLSHLPVASRGSLPLLWQAWPVSVILVSVLSESQGLFVACDRSMLRRL